MAPRQVARAAGCMRLQPPELDVSAD